jgi:hypothetical protein
MFETIGLLLALTAALDLALKPQVKIRVARWLQGMSHVSTQVDQNGYQYVEKIFGERLFSRRAVTISIILSLVSLNFSYIYAIFTSDFELVWIFQETPTFLSLSFFAIFLSGSIFGDILSYAQTRVFLKTIDQYRTGIVSIGLALADAVVSLSLFVFIFSCTRLIAYLIIISGLSGGQLISTQAINLDLLQERLPQLVERGYVSENETEWLQFLSSASERDSSIIDNSLRLYNESVVGPFNNGRDFSLKANVVCAPYGAEPFALRDTVQMLAKTAAGARGFGALDKEYRNLERDLQSELEDWMSEPKNENELDCAFRVLKIDRTMSPSKLMKVAGPTNAWWAAFEMTFFDTYSSIGFKFGPYSSIDPFNDIDRFYQSIISQSGYSFLDLTFADPNIPYLLSEFRYKSPEDTEEMKVPYSPMLASSLAVSGLFWIYVGIVFLSRGFSRVPNIYNMISSRFDIRLAPFTSAALVIVLFALTVKLMIFAIGVIWGILY